MILLLLATAETTTTVVSGDNGIPSNWLGWLILAAMVGLYVVVQRSRSRHTMTMRDREAQLRRNDPDLRQD